jgi:cysteine desulfurase / selenocysteine lyase
MKSIPEIRSLFPILTREVNGKPLVYLDNAASTQKPQAVIDTISDYYARYNANVHRGVHALSVEATEAMEGSRKKVQRFLNAIEDREIIFTSGTTHSINILAQSWAKDTLKTGDEILISALEHHSNIVPWQMACEATGAVLKVIPVTDAGELDLEAFETLLSAHTKLLSVAHVSNALGTVNPIQKLIQKARSSGALVHIDGAQAVAHMPVDVQALACDFYSFSAHKLYGPTGMGILYGKASHLEKMNPLFGGGEMIKSVSFEKTTYNEIPFKFEAGTPNIAGIIGLGAAIDFMYSLDWKEVKAHEQRILALALSELGKMEGMRFIGMPAERSGVISFLIDDIHPSDLGTLLDKLGIAVRTGHHCAEPLMNRFQIPGTLRASFGIYNTEEDVMLLAAGLKRVVPMLS